MFRLRFRLIALGFCFGDSFGGEPIEPDEPKEPLKLRLPLRDGAGVGSLRLDATLAGVSEGMQL